MIRWMLVALMLLVAACQNQGAQPEPTALTVSQVRLDEVPSNVALVAQRQLPTAVPEELIQEADAEHRLLANVYERIAPSVVNIEVDAQIGVRGGFSEVVRGSGFVYGVNGHLITNAHVVDGAIEILVTFNDGFVVRAEVVGTDIFSDIAVLRIDVPLSRLVPLALADSDQIHVGDRAIAIGNPFGLNSSMTVGIISGLGRQLPSASLIDSNVSSGFRNPKIIQVDADINPGNSGGPLLNSHGEVIGVNTAISSESGVFEGVGFAVPANTVARVVPELIENGAVDYSWIGIGSLASDMSLSLLVDELGLPVDRGVLVTGVIPDSPAGEAGIQGGTSEQVVRDQQICSGGDIIIAVDGEFIRNMDDLVAYLIIKTVPGDTVTFTIVRDGETFDVPVILRSRPADGGTEFPECGS